MSDDGRSWSDNGEVDGVPRRRKLGDVLVEEGILGEAELAHALLEQTTLREQGERLRLGAIIQNLGYATDQELARGLAVSLGLPLARLAASADPELAKLLPRQVAERHGILVTSKLGGTVTVAVMDPTNVVGLDDARAWTGAAKLVVEVAAESRLRDLIERVWSHGPDETSTDELIELAAAEHETGEDVPDVEEPSVDRLVEAIIGEAVAAGASHIHIEPQRDHLRIRFRLDGLLREAKTMPVSVSGAVVARLKTVTDLDGGQSRRPQSGRVRIMIEGESVEMRAATLPSLHGDKVVLRLLPRAESVPLLAKTGLDTEQLEVVSAALVASQGLVLLTGPTGSGKTNTLYAALQQLSTPDRNIVTLESPIEIQLPGITQVQITDHAGMSYEGGLHSVLQQDPDVILVGEAQDKQIAELTFQAALTGRLVLTTLHSNDTISAITRLIDMGVDPFLVASSLSLVVAQRLLRQPCTGCAQPYRPSPRTMELLGVEQSELDKASPLRGRGCEQCGNTGYLGRIGVFEVLSITPELRRVLLSTPTERAIADAARAHGLVSLRAAALAAASRGETTYEEVLRVTHVQDTPLHRCPACARSLADDMACCPYDGTVLVTNPCPGCGRGLDADWMACPYCQARTGVTHETEQAPAEELPKLLIVEPDAKVAEFLSTALEGSARTTVAVNASAALQAMASESFNGAVVDAALPDLNGLELVRLVRGDPRTLTLPIMLVSSDDADGLQLQGNRAGVDDVLSLPIEAVAFEERMLGLLERRFRLLSSAASAAEPRPAN